MPDQTYANIDDRVVQNVRKALRGSVFFAPTSAPAVTSITVDSTASPGTATLAALPTGYKGIGQIDDVGATLGNKVTKSDISGWGRVVPVRTDITAQQRTIQLNALEINKQSLATYFQVDPAAIVPNATTDEVQITEPDSPVAYYWRVLALAVDQNDSGEIYLARFFPYASVTDLTDIKFDSDKDSVSFGCTLTAYTDSVLGYSSKFFAGGPGWQALKTGMGFS